MQHETTNDVLMSEAAKLKRNLSWYDCVGIILGIILGTGIFSTFPTLIASHNPSVLMIMLAWIAGGVVSWFGALCYAELSSLFPHAGGDYTYLHKVYSFKGESVVSFLFAWTKVFVIGPSSIAILALICGSEMQKIIQPTSAVSPALTLVLALVIVFASTFINIVGIGVGKIVQNLITITKAAFIVFIIGYGIYRSRLDFSQLAPILLPENKSFVSVLSGFWGALVLSMWVYGGWNEAVYVAEETKEPLKNIPKALFFGIFAVTVLYIGMNLVYLLFLSPKGLSNTFNPASDIMSLWFGINGGIIMSSIIVVSAVGAINGLVMTGGRVSCAIARDYSSLNSFSIIHPTYCTPKKALLANLCFSLMLLLFSRGNIGFVENLTFYTAGVFWYFFALVVISLMLMRTVIPKEQIPFKVPFYPFSAILFLIITCGLICGSIQFKPFETLAGVSILTIAIPLYYILNFNNRQKSL